MQNSEGAMGAAGDKKARAGKWMARKFRSLEKFEIVIEMSWEHSARDGIQDGLRRQRERRGQDLEGVSANE